MFKFNSIKNYSKVLLILFISFDISFFKAYSSTLIESNPNIEYLNKKNGSDYIIGTGDTLFIKLSDFTPILNKRHSVNNEGFIDLPRLGLTYVKGLTINELQNLLNIRYEEFLHLPEDDPMKRKPDIEKAIKILEWEPKVNLSEGLLETINYFKNIL